MYTDNEYNHQVMFLIEKTELLIIINVLLLDIKIFISFPIVSIILDYIFFYIRYVSTFHREIGYI